MQCLLLLPLLLAADDTQRVGNARLLVDRDLSYQMEYADRVVVTTMISLRERDRFDAGTAWIIQEAKQYDRIVEWKVFKGGYKIFASDEPNILLIRLGLTRKYGSLDSERPNWKLDQRFEPQGADLEISLDENNSVPDEEINMLIARGFFVDEAGDETVKYYPPSGLLQKLSGQGEVRHLRQLEFHDVGNSYALAPLTVFKFDRDAPPGFLDRKRPDAAKR